MYIYTCIYIYVYTYIWIYVYLDMTVSTENSTSPKSIKSRNSDFSVSPGANLNWDFDLF